MDSGNDKPLSPNPTVDYFDDLDYFKDLENEFPAIVYNDGLTSKSDLGIKPLINSKCIVELNLINETSLSEYDEEIVSRFNDLFNDIHPGDLKSEKDVDDNDIGIIQSSEDNEITHGENGFSETKYYLISIINLYVPYGIPFDSKRYYKDGSHTSVTEAKYTEEIRRSYEQRLKTIWSRLVNRVHVLDFEGLTAEMRQDLAVRMSDTVMDLDTADTLCFQLGGAGSDRLIPDNGDLRDYWMEISFDRDFLAPAPSYVLIRDPVRRLCNKMIAYSISGRGQEPEKVTGVDLFYLRSMDCGTANVLHLLALVSDEGLRGLQVVTRELPLIDLHKLGRLYICMRYDDTWAWAPPPPPPALQPCTMSHMIERLKEEVHDLWRDVVGLQGDVASFTTEQFRVSTWLISCMTQLMDTTGQTYQPFDSTLVGSSGLSFRRRVRPRTGYANTSATPHTNAQPDP
ncbi:hypothetical protein Tco_0336419 [Tanacetum coccineum]